MRATWQDFLYKLHLTRGAWNYFVTATCTTRVMTPSILYGKHVVTNALLMLG
jgi:hypothetical protein